MASTVEVIIEAKDNFSGVLGNFGSIITGIESAVNLAADAFTAVATPIVDFGKEAILTAARVSELGVVNRILAENAGIAGETIPPLVDAIRRQGIEAAVANTVIASFIDANLDLSKAIDIARIAQDAAVISGQNSTETLANIVYGIETLNPLVLRHAGIVVDLQLAYKEWADENDRKIESLTTAEKQQIALNEVLEAGVDIAGAYAAAMEEPGKVLRSFPRYFDDILVAVGEPFQEAFGTAIFAIADFLKELGKEVGEGGALRPALNILGVIINDILETSLKLIGEVDWDKLGIIFRDIVIDIADAWNKAQEFIEDLKTLFTGVDLSIGGLDTLVSNMFAGIENQITLWVAGDGPQELSDKIIGWIKDIGTNDVDKPKFVTAAENLISALAEALGDVDWIGITNAMDAKLAEKISEVDWEEAGRSFGDAITKVMVEGTAYADPSAMEDMSFKEAVLTLLLPGPTSVANFLNNTEFGVAVSDAVAGWFSGAFNWDAIKQNFINIGEGFGDMASYIGDAIMEGLIKPVQEWKMDWNKWATEHIVDPIKEFFGISSPSTVFMGIGRDLVLGLVAGISSLAGWAATAIGNLVDLILAPFRTVLDLLGIDTGGSQGGSSGDATGTIGGGGTTGGRIPTLPDGTTGGGTVVNQYFAGATINVGSWDQIAYDCVYPDPFSAATSGQLGGSTGGRTGAR